MSAEEKTEEQLALEQQLISIADDAILDLADAYFRLFTVFGIPRHERWVHAQKLTDLAFQFLDEVEARQTVESASETTTGDEAPNSDTSDVTEPADEEVPSADTPDS